MLPSLTEGYVGVHAAELQTSWRKTAAADNLVVVKRGRG
jgi:hypothetical protein